MRRPGLHLILLGAVSLWAGDGKAPAEGFAAVAKESKVTPMDLLRAFEAPAETDYTLGEGDEINLTVWNRPELSGKHVIGPDGLITLPYVGAASIKGLTRTAAAAEAARRWTGLYEDINVTVDVLRYESNRIFVLGRVANPGLLRFDGPITLLEAVTRAGGLPIGGVGADKAALSRCIVFRGRDQLAWIDLKSLLNGSNLAINIRLQRNDTVYIPDGDDQLVYVMGEVLRPGAIRMTPDMNFLTALAQAGGPTDDARTGKIRLIRPSAGIEREIQLKDFYQAGKAVNFTLQDGDVIYVPRSRAGAIGYVFQKLSPVTAWMMFGSTLAR